MPARQPDCRRRHRTGWPPCSRGAAVVGGQGSQMDGRGGRHRGRPAGPQLRRRYPAPPSRAATWTAGPQALDEWRLRIPTAADRLDRAAISWRAVWIPPKHELADFAELTCWQQDSTSATTLSRVLGRLGENDHSGGVLEEEETDTRVEEAYVEIERRQEACRDGYPFVIGEWGHTLRAIQDADKPGHVI